MYNEEDKDWKSIIEVRVQVIRKAIREIEQMLLNDPTKENADFILPIRRVVIDSHMILLSREPDDFEDLSEFDDLWRE